MWTFAFKHPATKPYPFELCSLLLSPFENGSTVAIPETTILRILAPAVQLGLALDATLVGLCTICDVVTNFAASVQPAIRTCQNFALSSCVASTGL